MRNIYLTHALRAIGYNRHYMIISMAGLVLSLAGAIIIARYVHGELTVDKYIPSLDRTIVAYEVYSDGTKISDDLINHNGYEGYPAPHKDKDIEAYTQFFAYDDSYISANDRELEMRTIIADSSFLDLLPRKLLSGTAPKKEFEAVVTDDAANLFWPGENAVGQTMSMFGDKNSYTVVGVVDKVNTKCNFDFDVLLCHDLQYYFSSRIGWMVCRLRPGATVDSVNARTLPFERNNSIGSQSLNVQLMPLADLYFDTSFYRYHNDVFCPEGNLRNIRILEIVAALLILVGLFNFLNIYSIVMVTRGQAFAVRKTFGAKRGNVFCHIFTENLLVAITAVLIAWCVIAAVSPLLSNYYDIEQKPAYGFDLLISAAIAVILPLTVSAATTFSIWRNSKVRSMGNAEAKTTIAMRRYLLLLPQMTATLILFTVSAYLLKQTHFILNADVGFENENILSFKLWPQQGHPTSYQPMSDSEFENIKKREAKEAENIRMAMDKIKALPEALATASWDAENPPSLFTIRGNGIRVQKAGNPENEWINTNLIYLDTEQMDVFDLQVVEGITYADLEEKGWEIKHTYKMMANRNLVERLGITDIKSEKAQIERRVWYEYKRDENINPPYEIIGVVDPLRINPLSEEDVPTMIHSTGNSGYFGKPIIRYNPADKEKLLEALTEIYQEINGPDSKPTFEYSEDVMAEIYAKDLRTARIYATFALMSIFISCLGFYGVVAYDMQRRQREFTIRRVQGASRKDILRLVARPYAVTLCIATLIAAPLSIYAISRFQSYYYTHASMDAWGLLAGISTIGVIGYLAVWNQTKKTFKDTSF